MKTMIYHLETQFDEGLNAAAKAIHDGENVVMPTETVYGLGANAQDPEAVRRIFEIKGRPQDNPLIVHISEYSQAWIAAREISPMAEKVMRAFWPGPFTAVLKKTSFIPIEVTAGLDTVAIRLPKNEYAVELIRRSGCMIAAPSANLSGKPSPTKLSHVVEDLDGKVPIILDGGDADYGVESTVCDLTGEVPVVLRPGGVTAEMIREVAGDVKIANAVLNGLQEGEKAASPGMKYKHYAPKANVKIVTAQDRNSLAILINSLYDKDALNGKNPLILCTEETQTLYGARRKKSLGVDLKAVAHNLFTALREADEMCVDTVYFEATDTDGMGLAIMNRMIRAAGFQVIAVEPDC